MSSPRNTGKDDGNLLLNVFQNTTPPNESPKISEQDSQSPPSTPSVHPTSAEPLSRNSSIGHPVLNSIQTLQEYTALALEAFWADEEAIPSKPIPTITTKRSSKRLTSFTPFPKLPLELRFMIYNLAFESKAVWISRSRAPDSRQAISMVCKEAKQEYERQYKILKKRSSDLYPRIGPYFVNYKDDFVHFFHNSHNEWVPPAHWSRIMDRKVQRGTDIVSWLKPAQRVAMSFRLKRGDRGLSAPEPKYEIVWGQFNRIFPEMKELVFILADVGFQAENLVELRNFGGRLGMGEASLRKSFAAAQLQGFNVSARLVVMGQPECWALSKGKLVEVIHISEYDF